MKIAVIVAALIAGLGLALPPDRELRPVVPADREVGVLAPTRIPAADTGRQSPDSQGAAPAPFP